MPSNGFFKTENELVDAHLANMSGSAAKVYLVLARHARNSRCFPGVRTIMAKAGVASETATNAIADLEAMGAIRVARTNGMVSHYELVSASKIEAPKNPKALRKSKRSASKIETVPFRKSKHNKTKRTRPNNKTKVASQLATSKSGKPPQHVNRNGQAESPSSDPFEAWWKSYPKRGGRRRHKQDAQRAFKRVPAKRRADLMTATANYAKEAGAYAKDPHRFLRSWEDYLETVAENQDEIDQLNEIYKTVDFD